MASKYNSSCHSAKHPYLRPELWGDGSLAFYLKPGYNYESYRQFHEDRLREAQKLNKAR